MLAAVVAVTILLPLLVVLAVVVMEELAHQQ
jgi:hypothetical protein